MRCPLRVALLLPLLLALPAGAITVDAKAMARFDVGYARCEQQIPEMRGRRDEAYLSLWRVQPDAATRARLEAVRRGAVYKAERQRVLKIGAAAVAASAASPVEQQCQALWAETQRALKAKP